MNTGTAALKMKRILREAEGIFKSEVPNNVILV